MMLCMELFDGQHQIAVRNYSSIAVRNDCFLTNMMVSINKIQACATFTG
jgi:hypothetical protein